VKPVFTSLAKALEIIGSPLGELRAALHLEVARAEADADSYTKVSGVLASPWGWWALRLHAASRQALHWHYFLCCLLGNMQAAREVAAALSLNYPSDRQSAAACGYECSLDRWVWQGKGCACAHDCETWSASTSQVQTRVTRLR
jgi:hypothetical protein